MYYLNSQSGDNGAAQENLRLLEKGAPSPAESCMEDPEILEAFEAGLRQLAEDIVEHHPGLAHVLLNMGEDSDQSLHQGQN